MTRRGRLAAGVLGGLTLFAVGWTALLIPSLIRSIKVTFDQDDAGMGLVYLAASLAYAVGSFGGAALTERVGRRLVLGAGVLVHGLGVASQGLAPTFEVFVIAAMAGGLGAGCLDGGANGLVLDVFREGRGRVMNLLHVMFSAGALAAPITVGALVESGVPWEQVALVTGAVVCLLAIAYAIVPMPSGRRGHLEPGERSDVGVARLLAGPLLLLGIAIAAYVGSEIGVSSWLVRYLEPAPLTTATLALSLYWGGLAIGRLISSAIADRFDHLRFTILSTVAMGVFIAVAVLAPSLELSIAAFALAGVASGPVFPMIVAIGGERYPERSAAVGGSLAGMAIIGSVVYPPAMGVMSVTIGLTAAMLGNVVLALIAAAALIAFGRVARAGAD